MSDVDDFSAMKENGDGENLIEHSSRARYIFDQNAKDHTLRVQTSLQNTF